MTAILTRLAEARRAGQPFGITSVCSAHPLVIRAALRNAALHREPVLIEATCNQVNQFGGYTGMRARDFVGLVGRIAAEEGLGGSDIILGGDHLGPNPWRDEPADTAMAKAEKMVALYVEAGFRKLHLDTSMGCRGEPAALDDVTTATRALRLLRAAEGAAAQAGGDMPVYIIGTEVPPPGGAHHAIVSLEPTRPEAAARTIAVHRDVFGEAGFDAAFARVVGVVVQPGVEFGNENVVSYDRNRARALSTVLMDEPRLVYEAHSTDYQGAPALRELVEDGFPILKVGPQLTFALREALYGLDLVATDLSATYPARNLMTVMERLMLEQPGYWKGHYPGSAEEQRLQRHYSYSDRIRYYWTHHEAEVAVRRLVAELDGRKIPAPLMRQHVPQFSGYSDQPMDARRLLLASVQSVLDDYRTACLTRT